MIFKQVNLKNTNYCLDKTANCPSDNDHVEEKKHKKHRHCQILKEGTLNLHELTKSIKTRNKISSPAVQNAHLKLSFQHKIQHSIHQCK